MLAEIYILHIYSLLQYSFFICYLLKIILIDDSDATGFQVYRVLQSRHSPVDYLIITLVLLFYFGEGQKSTFGVSYFHEHI